MQQRPGSVGSFTAADHIAVVDAALAQVPAPWRRDVLVTVDGAGASHDLIDHLHELNTAARAGRRGHAADLLNAAIELLTRLRKRLPADETKPPVLDPPF